MWLLSLALRGEKKPNQPTSFSSSPPFPPPPPQKKLVKNNTVDEELQICIKIPKYHLCT